MVVAGEKPLSKFFETTISLMSIHNKLRYLIQAAMLLQPSTTIKSIRTVRRCHAFAHRAYTCMWNGLHSILIKMPQKKVQWKLWNIANQIERHKHKHTQLHCSFAWSRILSAHRYKFKVTLISMWKLYLLLLDRCHFICCCYPFYITDGFVCFACVYIDGTSMQLSGLYFVLPVDCSSLLPF